MESGGREATTTTTLDRPTLDRGGTRERYATEIRDRGDPGDEDAFVARAMMGRARRAREETRCIFMCTSTTVDRAGGARRARSTGRDADDEWMSERSNDRSIGGAIGRWRGCPRLLSRDSSKMHAVDTLTDGGSFSCVFFARSSQGCQGSRLRQGCRVRGLEV